MVRVATAREPSPNITHQMGSHFLIICGLAMWAFANVTAGPVLIVLIRVVRGTWGRSLVSGIRIL